MAKRKSNRAARQLFGMRRWISNRMFFSGEKSFLTYWRIMPSKGALSGEFKVSRTVRCHECGGEGCDDCGDAGEFEEETTVPWDTIKEIYRAAVLNHVGDTNEKAVEKCECSSIDYCDNCLRAMLDQPVNSGYKLVPVDFLTTASRLIDLCRTYSILSDGGNYKERTISECESTMEVIDGLLAAAPEGGNGE